MLSQVCTISAALDRVSFFYAFARYKGIILIMLAVRYQLVCICVKCYG